MSSRLRRFSVSVLPLVALSLAVLPDQPAEAGQPKATTLDWPLSFVANAGGGSPSFSTSGSGYALLLRQKGALLALFGFRSAQRRASAPRGALIRMALSGANPKVLLGGRAPLPGRVNYLVGNDRSKWRIGLASYRQVRYRVVYPGIDLVYEGDRRALEYHFEVAPGADPAKIVVRFSGARLRVAANGDLELRTAPGRVFFKKPFIYQKTKDGRVRIAGGWRLIAPDRAGFRLAAYDRNLPLIIDPTLAYSTLFGGSGDDLSESVAVDPAGNFYITGPTCSLDMPTTSGSFEPNPPFTGTYCPYHSPQNAYGFVAKFEGASPANPVYITFFGGAADPFANTVPLAIAVDASGDAYITGETSQNDLPITPGAYQSVCAPYLAGDKEIHSGCDNHADVNGFVTKFDPSGANLVYSTFIGGASGGDHLTSIALDPEGEAYVAGISNTTGSCTYDDSQILSYGYPTTPGAYQSFVPCNNYGGLSIPYSPFWWIFSKLSADGSTLLYSTDLFGTVKQSSYGSQWQPANSLAVNPLDGTAIVAGSTDDPSFPATPGAVQPTMKNPPNDDAFIAKFDPSQSGAASLVWATFWGGSGCDRANGVALDSAGNAFVDGDTGSSVTSNCSVSADFPTTSQAFEKSLPNNYWGRPAAWVSKLSAAGEPLWSTYLGGTDLNNWMYLNGIAVDSHDRPIVTGCTGDSGSWPFSYPQVNQVAGVTGGSLEGHGQPVLVTQFDSGGRALLLSTVIGGGNWSDCGSSIAFDASANPFVTGVAWNGDYPFPTTPGAFETGCADLDQCSNGAPDGFVLELGGTQNDVAMEDTPSVSNPATGSLLSFTITVLNDGTSGQSEVVLKAPIPAGTSFHGKKFQMANMGSSTASWHCKHPKPGATSGEVACSFLSLGPGSQATLSLSLLVQQSGGEITDTADVSYRPSLGGSAEDTAASTVKLQ